MSMNIRTSPSTTYSTANSPNSSPTNSPGASANGNSLAALAVALQTLKTALSKGNGAAPQAPVKGTPSGVSSFAPARNAGPQGAAGVQGTAGPQGVSGAEAMEAAPPTPMEEAQGALQSERQMHKKDMLDYPEHLTKGVDEFNSKRDEKNAKTEEKLGKLDEDLSSERAKEGGGDEKKLKKMEEERSKVEGELKPPLNPDKVTNDIDEVMSSDKPEKEKKDKLEEIRKDNGLEKDGGALSMDTFTKHLSQKANASKDRVEGMQKTQLKQLDGDIDGAKKSFGKDSPQVKALEEQKKGVDGMFNQRKESLKSQADTLHAAYHVPSFAERIHNFFKGIGEAIAAPFKAIGNVFKGVFEGVGKLFQGDIGGAFKSAAGGFKDGLNNIVDGAKATASRFGDMVSLVAPEAGKQINGFATGMVDSVGNVAKGALDTATSIPQGLANGAGKLLQGDVGGAFGAVGEGVKNAAETGFKTVNDGLPVILAATSFVPVLNTITLPLTIATSVKGAVEAGQRGDGLGVVASLAGGVAGGAGAAAKGLSMAGAGSKAVSTAGQVSKGAGMVETGANTAKAIQDGDYLGAVSTAAGGVSKGASSSAAKRTTQAGSLPAGSAAQAQAQASASRLKNIATGADLFGSGANSVKSLQEGDYFSAAKTAAGGVSKAVSAAYAHRPGANSAAPLPLQTVPMKG